MLEVCNLAVACGDRIVVSNVSFDLPAGVITGLLGPNGAGKSTMIKAILGLIPAATGVVRWDTLPLKQQLKRVAYLPQRSSIDWDYPITVERVVMMGRTVQTGWWNSLSKRSHQLVEEALQQVEMWKLRRCKIGELSGGQQQRVFLARALAQQADLLFFDEPFNNIDQKTEAIMFDVFERLKGQGKTLLVVSHDLGESLDNYDQFLLLNRELIAVGNKTEVFTSENLAKAFGNRFDWLKSA